MSLQGQTLGKYRILDPLGRGGMARVYRAYHPRLDRYVAIKVLRSDLVEDGAFLARFQREARAVAALRHPHIVQVYDFDVDDEIYYMVMELLEGDTLKARLNDYRAHGEPMPWGEIVRIALDVLDGLAYAHGEGMVHRDIKPGNILLTKRGQAVLTDFGIAQIVGGTRYTMTGALMGTLNYMAPEQGLEGRCDARCDIYSLGIVLYEMLTQSVPFDADTPLAILMKHLNDPLPLPRQIVPALPQPLERVVLKALSKQPDERHASAGEMAQVLRVAAEEAGMALPERVSLPRSFTTAEAPSESVAVLSGSARHEIGSAQFSRDETDVTLGERLEAEMDAGRAGRQMPSRQNHAQHAAVAAALPGHGPLSSVLGIAATLATWTTGQISRLAPEAARFLTAETKGHTARAVLSGIGVVAAYNILAVWIGGLTGWWGLFSMGWPLELLATSLGLCVLMYAANTIWLLIPAGILLGNGLLFAYCQVTGKWAHWAFLWPLELALIGGTLWLTIWLGRRRALASRLTRPVGCALGLTAVAWTAIVAAATAVASTIGWLGGH